jgi:hypothetical protein
MASDKYDRLFASNKVEIYTLEGLSQFVDFLKKYGKSKDLKHIEVLDLEGLTHMLPEFQKAKAIEMIAFILKNDPYIEELLMVNNKLSKEILEELAVIKGREETLSLTSNRL